MQVGNAKRKFGESDGYVYATINGKPALLTHDAADVAVLRAKRQPEDVPSLFARFKNWLLYI